MNLKSLSPCSQQLATGLSRKLDESNSQTPSHSLTIHFNIIHQPSTTSEGATSQKFAIFRVTALITSDNTLDLCSSRIWETTVHDTYNYLHIYMEGKSFEP
jgi:hypothetical protein